MHDPPKIAVRFSAERAAFDPAGRKHFPEPIRGNDLPPIPSAVLQTELTEPCQVSGAQTQSVAGRGQPLQVGKPDGRSGGFVHDELLMRLRGPGVTAFVRGNAERTEQRFIGKVHGFHPGGFEKNAGENVQADRSIVKCIGDAALPAKEVQRRLRPVLAGTHLRPRVAKPFVGGAHGKQMPDRHIKDRPFTALDRILRKVGKNLIIHAANHFMVDGDADQQRHDAFRGGCDMDAVCFLISVPLCGAEFVSVPQHADLAEIRLIFLYGLIYFLLIHCKSLPQNSGISPSKCAAFSKSGPFAPMVKAMSLLRIDRSRISGFR